VTGSNLPAVTVLQGGNPWSIIVIFSNLVGPLASADIIVDGERFEMQQGTSAAWSAGVFLQGSPKREETTVSFEIQLVNGKVVHLTNCFAHWPLAAGDSCDHISQIPGVALASRLAPTLPGLEGSQTFLTSPIVPNANSTNQTDSWVGKPKQFLAPLSR